MNLYWYDWILLISMIICVLILVGKCVCLFKLGAPKDLSEASGSVKDGVVYSCTTAMLPGNKESAYMHMPTYTAGVLYHIGIFLSLACFLWYILIKIVYIPLPQIIAQIIAYTLFVTTLCGVYILVKRLACKDLRELSSFDDYFSNIIVTLMQLFTAFLFLGCICIPPYYCIVLAIVFLWLPFGKIKHALYFLFARYHLGFFYGRRGSWPPPKI